MLYRECCTVGEMVITDERLYPLMGLARLFDNDHVARTNHEKRCRKMSEALPMIPLANELGDGPVGSGGRTPLIDFIFVRGECGRLLIHSKELCPQR